MHTIGYTWTLHKEEGPRSKMAMGIGTTAFLCSYSLTARPSYKSTCFPAFNSMEWWLGLMWAEDKGGEESSPLRGFVSAHALCLRKPSNLAVSWEQDSNILGLLPIPLHLLWEYPVEIFLCRNSLKWKQSSSPSQIYNQTNIPFRKDEAKA